MPTLHSMNFTNLRLFTDGSSDQGQGSDGIFLEGPMEETFDISFKLNFQVTNNVVEY